RAGADSWRGGGGRAWPRRWFCARGFPKAWVLPRPAAPCGGLCFLIGNGRPWLAPPRLAPRRVRRERRWPKKKGLARAVSEGVAKKARTGGRRGRFVLHTQRTPPVLRIGPMATSNLLRISAMSVSLVTKSR